MVIIEFLLSVAFAVLLVICVRRARRHLRQKDYGRAVLRMIIAGFIFLMLTGNEGYPGAALINDSRLLYRLTGCVGLPSRIRAGHSTEINFTGDGYSYRVWQVPDRVAAMFRQGAPQDRPGLPLFQQDWSRQLWQPTPSNRGYGFPEESVSTEFQRLMRLPGNFWCMTKKPAGDAEEVAVLDPRTGRMIYYESST